MLTRALIAIASLTCLLIMEFGHACPVGAGEARQEIEALDEELARAVDDRRRQKLNQRFKERGFSECFEELDKLSVAELESLFKLAEIMSYIALNEISSLHLRDLAIELLRRGELEEEDFHVAYSALVRSRKGSESEKFYEAFNELSDKDASIDRIVLTKSESFDETRPAVLIPSPTHENEFVAENVDLPRDGLVALVNPQSCLFSRRALDAMKEDDSFSANVRDNVVLLYPQEAQLPWLPLVKWNSRSALRVLPVFKARSFPVDIASSYSVPSFFVLRDGEVVEVWIGWTKENQERVLGFFDE